MKPKVNQPCPCKSGKKYKKCCMRKKAAPPKPDINMYVVTTETNNRITIPGKSEAEARKRFAHMEATMGKIKSIELHEKYHGQTGENGGDYGPAGVSGPTSYPSLATVKARAALAKLVKPVKFSPKL